MLPPAERLVKPGSPFELIGINGGSQKIFRHAPASLPLLLDRSRRFGERPFTSFDGVGVSFSKIAAEADRLAIALATVFGVRRGSRVAVLAPDSPAWIAAVFGVWRSGAVAVILDSGASKERVLRLLDTTDCAVLITTETLGSALRTYGDRRKHVLMSETGDWAEARYFRFGQSVCDEGLPGSASWPDVDPDEDALIVFTSGSSGSPKGVISTHRAVISGVLNSLLAASLSGLRTPSTPTTASAYRQAQPCSLLLTPFSHVAGLSHLLLMLHLAGKVVPYRWQPTQVCGVIAKERVTVISGADSSILADLLRAAESGQDLSSVQAVSMYGTSFPADAIRSFYGALPAVRLGSGYGLTETNGSVSSASGQEIIERPGTCGPVSPAVDICIRDHQGTAMPVGVAGDIWVRGPTLMRGYIAADRSTPSDTFSAGWFCTGDVGHLDADGSLFVHGRRRDVFLSAQGLLSCRDLERAVHAGWPVTDVAALVTGDPPDSHRLLVAVAPAMPSAVMHGVTVLLNRLSGLPPHRINLLMLGHIPRIHSGKPDRQALRQMVQPAPVLTSGEEW